MRRVRLEVHPVGLMFWALLYFFLPEREAAALLVPMAVHEAGHLAAMRLCRVEIYSVSLQPMGLKIACGPARSAAAEMLTAGAGSGAGLLLWLLLKLTGRAGLMAGVSLFLSLFNLMPVYPLDGGRLARTAMCCLLGEMRGLRLQRLLGDIFCCLLLGFSFYMLLCGMGGGLFAAACMCLLLSLRED